MIAWITQAILQVVIIHSSWKQSNIIYLMKILNSKDGLLNDYFHWIKDLIFKTCNLRYIKTFLHQILPKKYSLASMWSHHTIIEFFILYIKANVVFVCLCVYLSRSWNPYHFFKCPPELEGPKTIQDLNHTLLLLYLPSPESRIQSLDQSRSQVPTPRLQITYWGAYGQRVEP